MRANIIRHIAFEDLGNLHWSLERAGFSVKYFDAHSPEDLAYLQSNHSDLLVVLGGPIGVYDEEQYPFIAQEKAIIEKQLREDRPLLGICLGCQLIASVMGAKVYAGGQKEIGWAKVNYVSDGSSALEKIDGKHVLHWHGDTFDLPSDAKLLMSSDVYPNQAFSVGNNVLALQFHIEVVQQRVEDWLLGHACELSQLKGGVVKNIRKDSQRYIPEISNIADDMWLDWLASTSLPIKARSGNHGC